jgi:hypothetical protein
MCGEAGGTGNYPIEQRMDFSHGGSRLGATIGFGFLQSASPELQPRAAADMLPVISRLRHNAQLGATLSRRTAVFRIHNL